MEVFQAVTQFASHLIGLIGLAIAWAAMLLAGECHDQLASFCSYVYLACLPSMDSSTSLPNDRYT